MVTITRSSKSGLAHLTKTVYPKYHKVPKNPKTNRPWRENYRVGEVPHHWARNTIPHGKGGRMLFHDAIIYSYGHHFPIARHVKNRRGDVFVLFTSEHYSSETSKHKNAVRHSIGQVPVYYVPNVKADTREDHQRNLSYFEGEARELYDKSMRATRNAPWLLEQTLAKIHAGNRYAEAVGLTERIGSLLGGDLPSFEEKVRGEIEAAEAKLEALDATADERSRARNAAKLAAYQKKLAEWPEKLELWHKCLVDEFPEKPEEPRSGRRRRWHSRNNETYVRVSRGKFLQTTKGMVIPLDQVLPILTAIRQFQSGYSDTVKSLIANPEAPVGILGDALFDQGCENHEKVAEELKLWMDKRYKVKVRESEWAGHINWSEKSFSIGCHRVTFEEIERAAKAAGL